MADLPRHWCGLDGDCSATGRDEADADASPSAISIRAGSTTIAAMVTAIIAMAAMAAIAASMRGTRGS